MEQDELVILANALSDINRVKILCMLAEKETCACNVLAFLKITQPTLSYHMKLLTASGFVKAKRKGKWTYYSLRKEQFESFTEAIAQIPSTHLDNLPDLPCNDECRPGEPMR